MRISRLIASIVGGLIIAILTLLTGLTPLTYIAPVNWGLQGWLLFLVIWAIIAGIILLVVEKTRKE